MKIVFRRSNLGLSLILASVLAMAQPAPSVAVSVRIDAQPLDAALNAWAEQTGFSVLVPFERAAQGKMAPKIEGTYTPEAALRMLLASTDLRYEFVDERTVTIRAAKPTARNAGSDTGSFRLVQAEIADNPTAQSSSSSGSSSASSRNIQEVSEEIVVIGKSTTATKLDLAVRETPQSVTIIDRQRIEDQNTNEILEVLGQTTGLTYQQSGPLGADRNNIVSRGFNLTNYQVDGVARLANFGFTNDISDMAPFEQVEVVRGATGLLNGIGEPGGTVNLMRKRPTRGPSGYLSAQFGSFGSYRAEADASSPLTSGERVRGRLVGAYEDSDSFVDRLNLRKTVVYGVAEADLTDSTVLTMGVEYQRHRNQGGARFGTPLNFYDGSETHFARSANLATKWSYNNRDNLSLFSVLEQKIGERWSLRLDLEHSRRKYDSLMASIHGSDLLYPETGTTAYPLYAYRWSAEPKQNSANLHASGSFTLLGREHELVFGANLAVGDEDGSNYPGFELPVANFYDLLANGELDQPNFGAFSSGYSSRFEQSGVFAATRLKPAERLAVILGGRMSNWKVRNRQHDEDGVVYYDETNKGSGVFTPYAGVVFDFTRTLSGYFSYTDIFQPTTQLDVNAQVLEPSEGVNREVGIKMALLDEQLNISAAVFEVQQSNVPEWVGYLPDGRYYWRSIDGTHTEGYELEVAGRIGSNWDVSGGFSRSVPTRNGGRPWLIYIPKSTFKLYTSYRVATGRLQGMILGANLRWQSEIRNSTPVPALSPPYVQGDYAVVNLMARYRITPRVSAQLNFNNVLDEKYFSNVEQAGWYGEPRNVSVTMRFAY